MKKDKELGSGFIERACEDVGVKRGVYYNAKRNLSEGKPLSADQIKVMSKYTELIHEAKESLKAIKAN